MNIRKKIINFWFYNKTMVLVLAVSLLFLGYMEFQYFRSEHEDYDIAVVQKGGLTQDETDNLTALLESFGQDLNGDAKVIASLHIYPISLGVDGEAPEDVGALDADLVGKVSGIFLLEDPAAFMNATSGVQDTTDAVPVSDTVLAGTGLDSLYLYIRKDLTNSAYYTLYQNLLN